MSYKIRFGTDGWRGVIAEDYTFDNVRRCAQGFASYMIKHGKQGQTFVVGHDKRFHTENFALAAAEVLAGNGLGVLLTDGATPTPVIAFSVVNHKAAGAINITASHNPPTDNGFKVRNEHGGAIDPDGLKEIEALIPDELESVRRMPAAEAEAKGLAQTLRSRSCLHRAPQQTDRPGTDPPGRPQSYGRLHVGQRRRLVPAFLGGGKTEIIEIHNDRNPIFPEMKRPEPIPPNINVGLKTTVDTKADVLLITDGDADRVGVGDERAGSSTSFRCTRCWPITCSRCANRRGAIVKTLSTTSMLEKLGKLYNVPVYETGVGFKYVAPKMIETDAMIGGEESGGYAFRGNVPERDGILAGLFMLDMMVKLNSKPTELIELLFSKVGPHYYDRIDSPSPATEPTARQRILDAKPATIGGLKVTGLNTTDGFKFNLEDGGWLLIRFSGTEPIMRVYCETTHQDKVQAILADGLKIAGLAG